MNIVRFAALTLAGAIAFCAQSVVAAPLTLDLDDYLTSPYENIGSSDGNYPSGFTSISSEDLEFEFSEFDGGGTSYSVLVEFEVIVSPATNIGDFSFGAGTTPPVLQQLTNTGAYDGFGLESFTFSQTFIVDAGETLYVDFFTDTDGGKEIQYELIVAPTVAVPVPGSLPMLAGAAGLFGLLAHRRRKPV